MRPRPISIALAVASLIAALVVVASPAHAAVIDVTTTADGGPGSLRAAFATANGNGEDTEIVLGSGMLYQLTDCGLADPDLEYTGTFELTITGNGSTIEQTCVDRVIEIADGSLVVTDLTITGGDESSSGAGINIEVDGDLTVVRSTITGNHADGNGGGIASEDPGTISITDSTISGNTSGADGGAINNDDKDITVLRSTMSGNSASGDGGAVDHEDATMTVTNSTVSGNTSDENGGGLWGDDADIVLVNATVAGNNGPTGANIEISGGALTTTASVIAYPGGGGTNCMLDDPTVSGGYNFEDDGTCDLTDATDRSDAGDPDLGVLAENGGPTQTRLPAASGPLVDQIPEADCAVPDDQRGVSRPQNGTCDIGSVELAEDEPTPDGPVDPANPVNPATPVTPAAAAVATEPTFTG